MGQQGRLRLFLDAWLVRVGRQQSAVIQQDIFDTFPPALLSHRNSASHAPASRLPPLWAVRLSELLFIAIIAGLPLDSLQDSQAYRPPGVARLGILHAYY